MDWWMILVIVIAIPIILFPVIFIWYMNVSGLYTVIRETQKRRVARKNKVRKLRTVEEVAIREAR